MASPVLYGTPLSTYVRTVRMQFAEHGADYELVDVGVLDGECTGEEHRARHPFGKVPVLEHDGFRVYETTAITRYLERILPGPSLIPGEPRAEACMTQIMGIVDCYGYGAMIGGVAAYHLFPDFVGGKDEAKLAAGIATSRLMLSEVQRIMGDGPHLVGERVSLADLYLAPPLFYVSLTPSAAEVMEGLPALSSWWERMGERASFKGTAPPLG